MAKNNENKSHLKDLNTAIEKMNTISSNTTSILYGTDQNFHDETLKDMDSIQDVINKISSNYKQNTGENIIEFFTSLANDETNGNKLKQDQITKKMTNLANMVEGGANTFNINELFAAESDRFGLYESYKLLYDNIPQLAQALDTFVDNIMSPDDFTKNTFNVITDKVTNGDNSDDDDIEMNFKKINTDYKIDILSKEILKEANKLGDCFVAVLPMNKEFEKLLTEDIESLYFNDKVTGSYENISADSIDLKEDELIAIQDLLFEEQLKMPKKEDYETSKMEHFTEDVKQFQDRERLIKEDIANFINNQIVFTEGKAEFAKDIFNMKKDFDKESHKKGSNETVKVNGSIVKILEPERVIKLAVDKMNYGYYYIENLENQSELVQRGSYTIKSSTIFSNFGERYDNNDLAMNSKYKLISDMFIRNISKKIDKKFVNKSPEFKRVIYHLLKHKNLMNNTVKITYFAPNEVVHFGIGNDVYYESIFRPILFTAKIYLAVLTSQLMLRLVRAPEKRAFYIETDLDQDIESNVQAFVRDVKTKDIKMENLKDINTAMNSVGVFQDYFIPVVNGKKPVEIDTLQGMNVDLNDDFLQYLLKAMISGLGIPPEFLSYSEQTEFARSLAMQNGKFVRAIIVKQKIFAEQFSTLMRLLYENEFLNNDNDKNNDNKFDTNRIRVEFPSPSSLNMTNLSEQISNSTQIIDFITNTLVGENETDEKLKTEVKREVSKKILPSFDWDMYEDLLTKCKANVTKENLTNKANKSGEETEDIATY